LAARLDRPKAAYRPPSMSSLFKTVINASIPAEKKKSKGI
jgi:hypothetical protein